MGALLAVRRPANPIGWLLLLVGIGFGVSMTAVLVAVTADMSATAPAGLAKVAALIALATWPPAGVAMIATGFLFPTGRPQSARWARLVVGLMVVWGILYVLALVQPGPMALFEAIDNPIGVGPDVAIRLGAARFPLVFTWQGVLTVAVAVAMITRYRRAERVERSQLRWFLLAVAVTMGCTFVPGIGVLPQAMGNGTFESALSVGLFSGAASLIPIAIGIAILRYRLYDIDRLISRGLAYGAVSLILGGVFAVAGIALAGMFALVGQGQRWSITVAASTLLVLALFQPLRRRVQRVVDRRFDREHYDAERTVGALVGRLRADVDLESVRTDVLGVMEGTFRPTHAALWLRSDLPGTAGPRGS